MRFRITNYLKISLIKLAHYRARIQKIKFVYNYYAVLIILNHFYGYDIIKSLKKIFDQILDSTDDFYD